MRDGMTRRREPYRSDVNDDTRSVPVREAIPEQVPQSDIQVSTQADMLVGCPAVDNLNKAYRAPMTPRGLGERTCLARPPS